MSVRIHQTRIADQTMARESGIVLAMQGAFLPRGRGCGLFVVVVVVVWNIIDWFSRILTNVLKPSVC